LVSSVCPPNRGHSRRHKVIVDRFVHGILVVYLFNDVPKKRMKSNL
jgi:hypothetical protein